VAVAVFPAAVAAVAAAADGSQLKYPFQKKVIFPLKILKTCLSVCVYF
jgi:hypothetical protein